MELLLFIIILCTIISLVAPYIMIGVAVNEAYADSTVEKGVVVLVETRKCEDGELYGLISFKGKDKYDEDRIVQRRIDLSRVEDFEIGESVYCNNGVLIEEISE